MAIVDLLPDFEALVAGSDSEIAFRARLWAWLERQSAGPLEALLSDVFRLWSGLSREPSLADAREVVQRLDGGGFAARARSIIERHAEVAGHRADCDVVLLAGLRRPEGYSRFDRGRDTVFIGLDHPASLRDADHFELVLAHELTHAVRDPSPAVLADYGGEPSMTHDDFVDRHPLREHLVSEGLAGALSARAYPGKSVERYVFLDADEHAWCEAHRSVIAERMLRALEQSEPYRTFYAQGAVAPGSPGGCDYYFGFHLASFALEREAPQRVLVQPSSEVFAHHLDAFLEHFLAEERSSKTRRLDGRARGAPELAILPASVQSFYRDWLAEMEQRPEAARALERELASSVARERIEHGGEPYETAAFPLALAREEASYIGWAVEGLLRAAEKVVALYHEDPAVRAFFGLSAHFEALVLGEPRALPAIPLARIDSHWNGRRVRFLEINTNGTAGIVLADRMGPLWLATEIGGHFGAERGLAPEPLVARLTTALDAAWNASGRRPAMGDGRRHVVLLDWRDVPTRSEQEALCDALRAAGLEATRADPTELEYDGATLRVLGRPVDQVYRRLTLEDFLGPDPRLAPFVRAVQDGNVAVFGSFAGDVAHTKRLFAFLTHERWRGCFTSEERALIDAHVPWTRLLVPGVTLRGGELRELREIALGSREHFVLKPAEGHEGRDVLLGVEASSAEWERELDRRMGLGHVLQQYVAPPVRTLFCPTPGGIEPVPHFFHLGEFAFGGCLAGFLARVSRERVLSGESKERALPAFVLD